MLCVLILYISDGTYSLKSTRYDRYFEKLFMTILFTLRVFGRNLLRGNRRNRILFWCLTWYSNPGFSSNKPTHYLLDHGDLCIWVGEHWIKFSWYEHLKLLKMWLYTILLDLTDYVLDISKLLLLILSSQPINGINNGQNNMNDIYWLT